MRRAVHLVHHVRELHPGAFILRFDRHDLSFEPGQCVSLGIGGSIALREYSIYSGTGDDFLEVLVREIVGGTVSRALMHCSPGDSLSVEGPHGLFITEPANRFSARHLFVGSGAGISPFHCMVRSYAGIDYLLLHGVRTAAERHEVATFEASRRVTCVSRGAGGDFSGRVTAYLESHPVEPDRLCYLCGNRGMIDEAYGILRQQGIPREHLFAEVYF